MQKMRIWAAALVLLVEVCSAIVAPSYSEYNSKSNANSRNLLVSVPTPVHEFDFRSCTDGKNVSDTYSSLVTAPSSASSCSSTGVRLHGMENDFISMEAFSMGQSFTVEIIFKMATLAPHATLMDFHDTNDLNSLSVRLNGDATGLTTTVTDEYGNMVNMSSNDGILLNDTWSHVVWSVDGSKFNGNQTLFLQGIQVASTPSQMYGGYNVSASYVRDVHSLGGGTKAHLYSCCGLNTTESQGMLDATMAIYRVYNSALSSAQVSTLQDQSIFAPTATPTTQPTPTPTHVPTLWRGSLDTTSVEKSVCYLMAITQGKEEGFVTSGEGIKSGVSEVDDTPMYHIRQQFTFPFGGVRYRHAWINANGALFFTPNPPCQSFYSAGSACDFDSEPTTSNAAWVNALAVFASDFNPSDSVNATIHYWTTESDFVVKWENISLFGSSYFGFSFSTQIRASGHIRVFLESVMAPSDVSDVPAWLASTEDVLVGLRFDSTQLERTRITNQQQADRATWLDGTGSSGDGVDGVYGDRDSMLASNTMIDFCPVPTKLCMSPTSVVAGVTNQSDSVLLNLTAGWWGCDADLFNFRCVFDTVSTSQTTNATVIEHDIGITVQCFTPFLMVGSFEVSLQYNQVNDATNWQSMNDTTVGDLTVLSIQDSLLAENGCSASSEECDSCGVCGGDEGCVGCDGASVLAERDCAGVCDGAGSSHTDTNGVCCDSVNGSDCLGICGGSYSEGWNNGRHVYRVCCANVDCTGLCNGNAEYDSCGICSGGDSGHVANSDVDCNGICYGNTTCAPTPAIHPTKYPTRAPTHFPSPMPTHPPTLSPLFLAVISSAVVLEEVSASEWNAETSGAADSIFSSVLVDNIALLEDSTEVASLNITYYDLSSRRLTNSDMSSSLSSLQKDRSLVSILDGVLCRFTLEIYFLNDDENNNASAIFKNIQNDLKLSLQNGNFSTDLSSGAKTASNHVLANSTVNVAASLTAMAKYGKYYQTIIYRRPTPSPTLTSFPTHTPTIFDNDNDDPSTGNKKKKGYEGPNEWLILVIAIELLISIGLCICCIKVGRRTAEDPLELGQLAAQQRRDLLEGSVDASLFLARPGQLRDQYQSAVSQLPTLEWQPSITHRGVFLDDNCAICLTKYEDDDDKLLRVLNCGHGFHKQCLDEWLTRRNLCPLCKRVAIANLDARLNNQANPLSDPNADVRTGWYHRMFHRRRLPITNDEHGTAIAPLEIVPATRAGVTVEGGGDIEMSVPTFVQSDESSMMAVNEEEMPHDRTTDQADEQEQHFNDDMTASSGRIGGGGGGGAAEDEATQVNDDAPVTPTKSSITGENEEEVELIRKSKKEKKEKKEKKKEKKEEKKEKKKEKKEEKKEKKKEKKEKKKSRREIDEDDGMNDDDTQGSNAAALAEFRERMREEEDVSGGGGGGGGGGRGGGTVYPDGTVVSSISSSDSATERAMNQSHEATL